jgi:hypothetical protein
VLVIATNRPEDLDAAVLDRMDESMEVRPWGAFPNPKTVRPDYSDCLLIHVTKD